MMNKLALCLTVLVLAGCATLPGTVKEGQGVVVLPLSFVNDTSISGGLVDLYLHFNHDKVAQKISPRNGYTVITTEFTDLKVIGISQEPKDGAAMAGGIGNVYPINLELTTAPGSVFVAPTGLEVTFSQKKTSGYYSYFTNWYPIQIGVVRQAELREVLRNDANAKVWDFPE